MSHLPRPGRTHGVSRVVAITRRPMSFASEMAAIPIDDVPRRTSNVSPRCMSIASTSDPMP